MFILINNKPINITNIDFIEVVNHTNLLINLTQCNDFNFRNYAKEFQIDESQEIIKNNTESLITFETTFRIKIVFKDRTIIFSKSNNFYTEIDATNKMKELCLLCNKVEASLPKINI